MLLRAERCASHPGPQIRHPYETVLRERVEQIMCTEEKSGDGYRDITLKPRVE